MHSGQTVRLASFHSFQVFDNFFFKSKPAACLRLCCCFCNGVFVIEIPEVSLRQQLICQTSSQVLVVENSSGTRVSSVSW